MSRNQKTVKKPAQPLENRAIFIRLVVGLAALLFTLAVVFLTLIFFSYEITDRIFVMPTLTNWQKNQRAWKIFDIAQTGMKVTAPASWIIKNEELTSTADGYQVFNLQNDNKNNQGEGVMVGISLAKLTTKQAENTYQENYYFNYNCGDEYLTFVQSGQKESTTWQDCHGQNHDRMYFKVRGNFVYSVRYYNHYTWEHTQVTEDAAFEVLDMVRDSIVIVN